MTIYNLIHMLLVCFTYVASFFVEINAIYSVHLKIKEEEPTGTVVGTLWRTLPDYLKEKPQNVIFRGLHDQAMKYFALNSTTSELVIVARIDREHLCPSSTALSNFKTNDICQLSFRVNVLRKRLSTTSILGMIRVYVEIEDIDDHSCTYLPSDRQVINVAENANATKFDLNRLEDADEDPENSIFLNTIRLEGEHSNESDLTSLFKLLIFSTGLRYSPFVLQLFVKRPLDFESKQMYNLSVIAGGQNPNKTCRLQVLVHVIDQNDHRPQFEQKSVTLKIFENTTISEPIYQARALDEDKGPIFGTLIYGIAITEPVYNLSLFFIAPHNGSLYLRQPLDYERQNRYRIVLVVRNPERDDTSLTAIRTHPAPSAMQDTMTVTVEVLDVNDNIPVIKIYALNGSSVLTLEENIHVTPVDFGVVSVSDPDNNQSNEKLNCSLDELSEQYFQLEPINQQFVKRESELHPKSVMFKLSALRAFDRELNSSVGFSLLCNDNGEPNRRSNVSGVVELLDVNDNAPEFETRKLILKIVEDSDPERAIRDYFITTIKATDKDIGKNGRISYSLLEHEVQDRLWLDSVSGILKSKGSLDHESEVQLQFTISATDHGNPAKTSFLTVKLEVSDYNDNPPMFQQAPYTFILEENTIPGTRFGQFSVCDADSGVNGVDKVSILRVKLTDGYHYIDIIESIQLFQMIRQPVSKGTCHEVNLFTKTSIDREELIYLLNRPMNGEPNLLIMGSRNITSEPMYELTLQAEDGGEPRKLSTAIVRVIITDTNDNSPRFVLPSKGYRSIILSVYEQRNADVLGVTAIDEDHGSNGTIEYNLDRVTYATMSQCNNPAEANENRDNVDINLNNLFHVNSSTGLVTLRDEIPGQLLGRTLSLHMRAKDLGPVISRESELQLCVKIADVPPYSANWSSTTGHGRFQNANTSRAIHYLYIVLFVLITALVGTVSFLVLTYYLRKRVKSAKQTSGHFVTSGRCSTTMQSTYPEHKIPIYFNGCTEPSFTHDWTMSEPFEGVQVHKSYEIEELMRTHEASPPFFDVGSTQFYSIEQPPVPSLGTEECINAPQTIHTLVNTYIADMQDRPYFY